MVRQYATSIIGSEISNILGSSLNKCTCIFVYLCNALRHFEKKILEKGFVKIVFVNKEIVEFK